MKGRMAMTVDGRLTTCRAPEDKIGSGRCNHIAHQNKNENAESFLKRVKIMNEDETMRKVTILSTEPGIVAEEAELMGYVVLVKNSGEYTFEEVELFGTEILMKEGDTEESVYMKIDEALQGARQANIIDDIGLAYYKNGKIYN